MELFPTDAFVEAGLTDAEVVQCATNFPAYSEESRAKVLEVADASLGLRKAAVEAWREHTNGHPGVGLPGAVDDGPRTA